MKANIIKFISIIAAFVVVFSFAGCKKSEQEPETKPEEVFSAEEFATEAPSIPETTTEPETTTLPPETTTAFSIQGIVDTLESKNFYMSGKMNITGGQKMNAKMNCSGDSYSLDIMSSQMNISFVYIDDTPYLVNPSTKMYAPITEDSLKNVDQIMSALSNMGLSMSNADMSDMKSMMQNFDMNMDYSQYIENGEYSEYNQTIDGVDYICSEYKTDYGTIRIYTHDGELKIIDVYADGQRQMNFIVDAFVPQVINPITLNGLTQSNSIVNIFTGRR